jgi:hypothetical protein
MSKDEDLERLITLVVLHALISKDGITHLQDQLKQATNTAKEVIKDLDRAPWSE